MTDFNWGDDDAEFRDVPGDIQETEGIVEAHKFDPPPQPQQFQQFQKPVSVPTAEIGIEANEVDADDNDYADVLNDARLRLEQGRLYEMLINQDIFKDLDIDPRAVKHVQKEIKAFARERMEIMLGIRRETTKIERLEIDFPFNALEVEILKKLAYTATKGASANSERFTPEVKATETEVEVAPRRTGLSPITGGPKKPQPKPLAKTTAPVQRPKAAGKPVVPQQPQDDYVPLDKPPSLMSEEELKERARQTAERQAGKKADSPLKARMPTFEEQYATFAARAESAAQTHPGFSKLLDLINSQKKPSTATE